MNENEKNPRKSKSGRKPKTDPVAYRYTINLNERENAEFLTRFELSQMHSKSKFIASCVLEREMKVTVIDKGTVDFAMRLTTFFGQFRAIGVNYNQIVKALKTNFEMKRAMALLYKLEQATYELVVLNKSIIKIVEEFEQKWLRK